MIRRTYQQGQDEKFLHINFWYFQTRCESVLYAISQECSPFTPAMGFSQQRRGQQYLQHLHISSEEPILVCYHRRRRSWSLPIFIVIMHITSHAIKVDTRVHHTHIVLVHRNQPESFFLP
jgi:hypothetical protein